MEEWKHQINLKIGYHMTNHRFDTLKGLSDFLGFAIEATPEMIIERVAGLEKKINEYMGGKQNGNLR